MRTMLLASIHLLILKSLECEALGSFKTTHPKFITFLPTQIASNCTCLVSLSHLTFAYPTPMLGIGPPSPK